MTNNSQLNIAIQGLSADVRTTVLTSIMTIAGMLTRQEIDDAEWEEVGQALINLFYSRSDRNLVWESLVMTATTIVLPFDLDQRGFDVLVEITNRTEDLIVEMSPLPASLEISGVALPLAIAKGLPAGVGYIRNARRVLEMMRSEQPAGQFQFSPMIQAAASEVLKED